MNRNILTFLLILISITLACISNSVDEKKTGIAYIDTGVNPDSWAIIPAGEFLKGPHNHITNVDYDYEIMTTDVTNAQYIKYLTEALLKGAIKISDNKIMGAYPGEIFHGYKHEFEIKAGDKLHVPLNEQGVHIQFDGEKFSVEKGYENHPMVMVSWFGAKAYADFYGWRLPTEIEWEKAARGTDSRAYPWGDELFKNQANYYIIRNLIRKNLGKQTTTPVGYFNGKNYDGYQTKDSPSPYGLYDMAGNVWQWTGDDYPDTHLRYLRGGSRANYEYNLCVWARNNAGPEFYGINIGFRCARDIEVKEISKTETAEE